MRVWANIWQGKYLHVRGQRKHNSKEQHIRGGIHGNSAKLGTDQRVPVGSMLENLACLPHKNKFN